MRPQVASRHAAQLDEEIGERPAGTQEELLASTYVLGHLQSAGYLTRLDPVPVKNLVRSTNVIGLPPDGGPPEAVVVVAYDTARDDASGGDEVGAFLEIARALRARVPQHSVEFVGLGAERSREPEGGLGSRRLARRLLDEDVEPVVLTVVEIRGSDSFAASGEAAPALLAAARAASLDVETRRDPPALDVFARAGFEHAWVSGDVASVGRALLDYLASVDG